MKQLETLQQEDVTYLFWLEYGRLCELPTAIYGLVCEAEALRGAQVIGRPAMFVQVSQDGLCLIAAIRDDRDNRFYIPRV